MELTVLIVEDNVDNRIIYRDFLEFAGHRVIEAVNGREAVEICARSRPDAVLMDLSMPVMDGWEAVDILKRDPATANIPVIALSAHVQTDGEYGRAQAAGFADYLTKPIEPKEVVAEIERIVERGRAAFGMRGEEPGT
jgi:CheY-like chemotaxis protein